MIEVLFLNCVDLLFGVLCVSLLMGYAGTLYLLLWGWVGLWLCCWLNGRLHRRAVQTESLRLQRIEQSKVARRRHTLSRDTYH